MQVSTFFFAACELGDIETVKTVISEDATKLEELNESGCTPLMLAASEGQEKVLRYLIQQGADVYRKNEKTGDSYGDTALHFAARSNHIQCGILLVKVGASITLRNESSKTPLDLAHRDFKDAIMLDVVREIHRGNEDSEDNFGLRRIPLMLAVGEGRLDVVEYLIDHGADVNKKDDICNRTALHYVSKRGQIEVVELLLSKGAEIDVEDENHRTPLLLAAAEGHNDTVLYLIDHGADVSKKDDRKRTALHYASESGYLKLAELLLSKGAEINIEDEDRRTPLLLAAAGGHNDTVLYLINHGADVSKKDDRKRTALHYASESGYLKLAELLLSKGAEINIEDEDRRTPLLLAAAGGHNDTVLYLINHGADVSKKDDHKRTALHYASESGHLKLAELLLSKGVEINIEDEDHRTPLVLAVKHQRFNTVYHLIKAGADVRELNSRNYEIGGANLGTFILSHAISNNYIAEAGILIANGVGIDEELNVYPPRTALTLSAENGHDSLVRDLILQGVNINYQDANGRSALHFAASSNHIQCGILLVEAGADLRLVDRDSCTPLDLATKKLKDAITQTLSFNTKKTVCIIGNACSGKSTLIASLKNGNAELLDKVYHWLFGVKNIREHTAGITPVPLSSKRYGDTVFLDFAGQHKYHGPHEMFLESISSKSRCTVTIIMVVKVTDEESAISHQLDRWLHPVSKMATSTNPIRVVVIGSHWDKVKSKAAAKEKLERCYERVRQSLCDAPLQFHDACYLDCRQPYSSDMRKLCAYLNEVPIPQYKTAEISYSICWVISRMKTSLDSEAIRVSDFTKWIEENKANLPTNLPPSEEVCKDLMSTDHYMYLPNKEDPSNGWLVLDLPSILHKVYGTLFSPSKKIVNKFGLLNCQKLSVLFPTLDQGMVRDVLTSLEFCIDVDPSILAEEVTQLTESTDKDHDHLFFPALVSSQPPKVFPHSQQGCHVLSWQLVVVRRPFISPRLLQTIILRLAAHRVFHCKQDSHTREHYCSLWCNGIFWQSTEDIDVAVLISDSTVVEVIGRSEVSPKVLCSYVSTIVGDISATIRELSPTLSATAYIIHPADPQVLLENPRSPSPHEKFPVDIILESIRNAGTTCLSCKVEKEPKTRKPISDLFGGFVPKEDVIRRLSFVAGEFVCLCVCIHVNWDVCYSLVLWYCVLCAI